MTDKELAEQAWVEFTKTTDSYPAWVKKGKPSSSHWAHGKSLLDQIGAVPIPPPVPTLSVTQTIKTGDTISAPTAWEAKPSAAVSKVEFYIDGTLAWTEQISPYFFNGDGQKFDPATLSSKDHTFDVRAISSEGAPDAWAKAVATVKNPDPVPIPPVPSAGKEGRVGLMPDMSGGSLDASSKNSADHQAWNENYDHVLGYGGFGWDNVTPWYKRAFDYIDSYAIYRSQVATKKAIASIPEMSDEDKAREGKLWGLQQHHDMLESEDSHYLARLGALADMVLKTADGTRVFIDWGCSGGVCPQYAADVGNQGWRDEILRRCKEALSKGYQAIYFDDVNLTFRFSNGTATVTPIDPRTNAPLTSDNWKRYFVEFMEFIRAQLPGVMIAHNSIWYASQNHDGSDAISQRQFKAANLVTYERGFNDTGIHAGTDQWSFDRYMKHMDNVHSAGANIWTLSYDATLQGAKFNLGATLLVSKNGDMNTSRFQIVPPNIAALYKTDLGAAKGPRYGSGNVIKRDFDKGTVSVDFSAKTATIPGVA